MLNPKHSYKAYSKTDVNTSDQLTLIIMLYDGLLRFLKKAMVKIEENDVEAAHNYFVRSKDIVNELLSTLHAEKGGDIGNNLRELYLYMFRRIVEANLKKDIEITKDVYQVAKTLHEGWIQLKSRQQNKETPNKVKLKSAFRAQGLGRFIKISSSYIIAESAIRLLPAQGPDTQ